MFRCNYNSSFQIFDGVSKCLRCVKISDCQICYFYAHLICVARAMSDEFDILIVDIFFIGKPEENFSESSGKARDKFRRDFTY
jgi:hypothetical protein